MDHILPHVRVPLSELSCKEDGHCVNYEKSEKRRTLFSYVHYNVSIHAVEIEPKLTRAFNSLISDFSRPLFLGHNDKRRQVDVNGLEVAIDGMLSELGVLWNYNILLINPKKPNEEGFMYRAGLSEMEIQAVSKDQDLVVKLNKESSKLLHRLHPLPNEEMLVKYWQPQRPGEKFEIQRLMYESSQWADKITTWLKHRSKVLDQTRSELASYKDLLLLRGIHPDFRLQHLLDSIDAGSDRPSIKAFGDLRVMEPEEGCPLDAWNGHHRWSMLDFAATPQDWGPFVGGDGIKTLNSLPSIEQYFSPHPEDKESQLKEKILEEKTQRVQELKSLHLEGEIPADSLFSMEFELFNRFFDDHCRSLATPPVFCAKIELAIKQMVNHKETFTTDEGVDLLRAWLGEMEDPGFLQITHSERTKDLFLAHVSSLISRAIRHVFLPPTLTWKTHHFHSIDYESSNPFTRNVNFRIYLLQEKIDGPGQYFDLANFKKELLGLRLENQNFHFVVDRQKIYDDPTLASSLSASLKSTTVESIGFDLSFKTEERIFFDSLELQELLNQRFMGNAPFRSTRTDFHGTLEVPVFVLLLSRPIPVFIDEHSLAKALDNMVIVVQNDQYRGQHPVGITCGGSITGTTPSAPLKAAVAATLQHLGGVLPPHLGYSPSHRAITHDWLWSTGSNPFSLTSPGWKVSQPQKDALHRTYLLDAIDLSVEQVNYGIELLQRVTPSEASFQEIQKDSAQLVQLLKAFSRLVESWRAVMSDLSRMEFQSATEKIHLIESDSNEFLMLAEEVTRGLEPLECKQTTNKVLGFRWLSEELIGGLIFILVLVGVYSLLPKKRKKKPF